MSSKRVLVVTCDRCGYEENMDVSDPLMQEEFSFRQKHDDWGAVKLGGAYLDLCPSCNKEYSAFFKHFACLKNDKTGGPLDEAW